MSTEILTTGEWRHPVISVATEDITTVEQARQLAVEVLEAGDILDEDGTR
jgi:hypothetical protein